ncbi:MAG: FAD-dependent oxidoreductase, partial [Telluria sp.]
MKIAIAGGGIGGLTTAMALHRRGFDVTVFEP